METQLLLLAFPGVLIGIHDGSSYHHIRVEACQTLIKLHTIFDNSDIFLEDGLAREARQAADRFLLLNNFLLRRALERNQLMYQMVAKTHMMWHLADMSYWQNPKWTSCFEFEDFIGKQKRCAKTCIAGSSLMLVGSKVMEQYLLSLHLKLDDLRVSS